MALYSVSVLAEGCVRREVSSVGGRRSIVTSSSRLPGAELVDPPPLRRALSKLEGWGRGREGRSSLFPLLRNPGRMCRRVLILVDKYIQRIFKKQIVHFLCQKLVYSETGYIFINSITIFMGISHSCSTKQSYRFVEIVIFVSQPHCINIFPKRKCVISLAYLAEKWLRISPYSQGSRFSFPVGLIKESAGPVASVRVSYQSKQRVNLYSVQPHRNGRTTITPQINLSTSITHELGDEKD